MKKSTLLHIQEKNDYITESRYLDRLTVHCKAIQESSVVNIISSSIKERRYSLLWPWYEGSDTSEISYASSEITNEITKSHTK